MNVKDLPRLQVADYLDAVGMILTCVIVIASLYKWYSHRKINLPPGPSGLPFVGYLPFLSKLEFIDFKQLAKKYGNIFSINLGGGMTVILNDFESVKEAFSNPAIIDRPPNMFHFIPNGLGFVGHNGAEWIEQRRFTMRTLKDIGMGRIPWETTVEAEVEEFAQLLEQQGGKPFDPHEPLSTSVSNNITSIILGKRLLKGDRRKDIVDGGVDGAIQSLNGTNLTTLFPKFMQFICKLGLTSYAEAYKKLSNFHNFITNEVEQRKRISSTEWNEEIFIDGYLMEMQKMKEKGTKSWFNEINLVGTAQSLLIGGSDTSRTFLTWIFLAMAVYPEVQKKVQKEIDTVLGKDGKLKWSERTKLPYTFGTMLETHRWRTITPLGVVHRTSEDTKIGGYDIPKGSTILPNVYSLHNDPKYWKDPKSFQPERFLDTNGCLITARLDSYAPFSLGRRSCPGEMIAMMETFHYFTAIMQKFDIRPVENSPPNIDEGINGATYQPVQQKLRYILRE